MLSTHTRALAFTMIVFAFCLLPVGAAMACEVCPPDDCHEQTVQHTAPEVAVPRVPALPAELSVLGAVDQPPHASLTELGASRAERGGLPGAPLRL